MPHAAASNWPKATVLAVVLAAVVGVVLLAVAWPAVTAEPRDLPVAIAGPSAAVGAVGDAVTAQSEGAIALVEVDDLDAAVALIEERGAYGAILLGPAPEVLTASAASPVVAQLLGGVAGRLQEALGAQAPAGAPVPSVTVTDVVPLADADPRGAGLGAAVFPILLGGILGGAVVALAIGSVVRRLVAIAMFAVLAALAVTAVLQSWWGVLQGSFLANAGLVALALLAVSLPVIGLHALLGRGGIGLAAVVFVLFANPLAGAALPPEFVPAPWGAVGQWFPPGAAATLLRDASYFPAAPAALQWTVLAAWAAAGLVLALAGGRRTAPAPDAAG